MNLNPNEDGITHLNVYSRARTELGQILSNFRSALGGVGYETPHGRFLTLEGYYHYLRIREMYMALGISVIDNDTFAEADILRRTNGIDSIRTGRRIKNLYFAPHHYRPGKPSDWMTCMFTVALVNKLWHEGIWAELGELVVNGTPLVHYYEHDGGIRLPTNHEWLPDLLTTIGSHCDLTGVCSDKGDVLTQTLADLNLGSME